MTNIKRNFNESVLKLQQEKQQKCVQLATKIERFCANHKRLHPDKGHLIDVKDFTEKTKYFDGKAFKVVCRVHCAVIQEKKKLYILQMNRFPFFRDISRKQ